MADLRVLAGFAGAARGFNKASENILRIQEGRAKKKQDDERFNMDMKIKKLQLQKAEEYMSPEEQKLRQGVIALEGKKHKLEGEQLNLKFDAVETQKRREKEGYGKDLNDAASFFERVKEMGGVSATFDIGEDATLRTKTAANTGVANKRQWDMAEKLARNDMGLVAQESISNEEVEKYMPKAGEILSGKSPALDADRGSAELPSEVDTSEYWSGLDIKDEDSAVQHLIDEYDMTEEGALEWLKGE